MLAFITTIRHPRNSASFERVGKLLSETLESICRQTDGRFVVVIVHNEMPPLPKPLADERIRLVPVDFPAPAAVDGPVLEYSAYAFDKGTKTAIGVRAAQDLGAQHLLFFDADDLAHHRLAEHANAQPGHPGWYSPTGFIHTIGTGIVRFVPEGFHLKNGSTGIVRTDLADVPRGLSLTASQDEIVDMIGSRHVVQLLGNHGKWDQRLAEDGLTMDPLPFPAAVWRIGTGENVSGNLISGRAASTIDDRITDAFGLIRPSFLRRSQRGLAVQAERLRRRLHRP